MVFGFWSIKWKSRLSNTVRKTVRVPWRQQAGSPLVGVGDAAVWDMPRQILVLHRSADYRDALDIPQAGYWSLFTSGLRPDTGYGKPNIRLSIRPDIRPNKQYIGLYKKRRETFFYWKNLLLLTVVYCKEIIRVSEKCQDVFFFLKS